MRVVSVSTANAQPDAALSWSSWYQGIRAAATRSLRTRYTTEKATRYFEYAANTSPWRHAVVVAGTPLPGLLASLVAPCIPAQSPSAGVLKNTGFCLHIFVTIAITMVGSMMQARAVTRIKHDHYTNVDIAAVAVIGSAHVLATVTLIGYCWRFPVPFSWVILFAPWILSVVWANILVLRSRLLRPHNLANRFLFYMPSLVVQVGQIVIYPAYSAAFEASGHWGQLVLIAVFPFMKLILKRSIYAVSHHLTEFAKEISVGGVEISASMYQSMIMQSTPSQSATALVIGLDVAQGFFDLKMFMDHETSVPNADILTRAVQILPYKPQTSDDMVLNRYASKSWSLSSFVKPLTALVVPAQQPERVIRKSRSRSATSAASNTDDLVLTQALELLQAAESLLLIEYLEVAIPIVNTIYLCVASQLKSAVYNPKLQAFYLQPAALRAAVDSVLLYASLQAVTLVAMCLIIRVRYQLSALTLLAFVLEDHAWSLQGKMLAWVPCLFAFSVLQYGVDFTFQFKYAADPVLRTSV